MEVSIIVINQEFSTLLNSLITDKYSLANLNEVIQYLQEKKELLPFLLEAERQIRKFFAKEKLTLKIIYDPEIANWKKLIIAIHTPLEADEAFDKLKLLDHNWWLDASYLVHNNLDIYIDFDEI